MDEQERIDAYLRDELSPEVRDRFELQMADDKFFRLRVEEMKEVHSALQTHGKKTLRETFEQIDQQDLIDQSEVAKPTKTTVNAKPFFRWAIAASLLIFTLWYFARLPTTMDNTLASLYEEHFMPFPNISKPLVRGIPDDLIEDDLDLYNRGEYKNFIRSVQNQEVLSDTMMIYLASAQLAEKQLEEVSKTLQHLIDQGSPRFKQAADWYKLMLALKEENNQTASELIDQILSENDHIYHERTQKIKNVLKK